MSSTMYFGVLLAIYWLFTWSLYWALQFNSTRVVYKYVKYTLTAKKQSDSKLGFLRNSDQKKTTLDYLATLLIQKDANVKTNY